MARGTPNRLYVRDCRGAKANRPRSVPVTSPRPTCDRGGPKTLNPSAEHFAADSTDEPARRLILVPILHSPADMGSLAEGLAAAIVERFGRRHWDEYLALLDGFWKTVRAELDALALDATQVDLYQDGLPVCGKEAEIVAKAAAAGSENHQLLMDLAGRGATLMGTEDPGLLLEEYDSLKAATGEAGAVAAPSAATLPESPRPRGTTAQRLSKRDAFIARRIDASLRPGRTGILFLGMMHHVEDHLPADIVVTRLPGPGAPGFRRAAEAPTMARNGKAQI